MVIDDVWRNAGGFGGELLVDGGEGNGLVVLCVDADVEGERVGHVLFAPGLEVVVRVAVEVVDAFVAAGPDDVAVVGDVDASTAAEPGVVGEEGAAFGGLEEFAFGVDVHRAVLGVDEEQGGFVHGREDVGAGVLIVVIAEDEVDVLASDSAAIGGDLGGLVGDGEVAEDVERVSGGDGRVDGVDQAVVVALEGFIADAPAAEGVAGGGGVGVWVGVWVGGGRIE